MKYFTHALVVTLLLLAAAGMAQSFEGVIVQKTTSTENSMAGQMQGMQQMMKNLPPDQRKAAEKAMRQMHEQNMPGETTVDTQSMYIKKGKMRIEQKEEGEPIIMIMDLKNHKVVTLYPNKKLYMVINLDEMAEKARQAQDMMKEMGMSPDQSKEGQSSGKLQKTGKKKNINGFMCEQYMEQNEGRSSEYWITRTLSIKEVFGEYGESLKSLNFMEPEEDRSMKNLFAVDGFPILSIERNENGVQTEEVIKIERKKLNDRLFSVPAGYKKITMQDMMQENR